MKVHAVGILGVFVLSGIALFGGILAEKNGIAPDGIYLFSALLFILGFYLALSKARLLGSFGVVR